MNIKIIVANPSGNKTAFVLTPFDREQYKDIGQRILAKKELELEQVSFIKIIDPYCIKEGTINGSKVTNHLVRGKMEMCGLEFCGNATRSFGLILAQLDNRQNAKEYTLEVSGTNELVKVNVNANEGTAGARIPSPISVETVYLEYPGISNMILVDLGGIIHSVIFDVEYTEEKLEAVYRFVNDTYNPKAVGVMFYNLKSKTLRPFVFVNEIGSFFEEKSCGSGTMAVSAALSLPFENGVFSYEIRQPGGVIRASIKKEYGNITASYIDGEVTISPIETIEI